MPAPARPEPPVITLNLDSIPQQLKDRPAWGPWHLVWRPRQDGSGRWEKVPLLSTARPHLWRDFATVTEQLQPDQGLGFCLTGQDDLIGFDLDHVLDEQGEPAPWARELLALLDSYTEITVSGTGLRVFVLGHYADDWVTRTDAISLEVYSGFAPRYLTVSGQHWPGSPTTINRPEPEILEQVQARFRPSAQVVDFPQRAMPRPEACPVPDLPEGIAADARAFFETGECAGDRSAALVQAARALLECRLTAAQTFAFLCHNSFAMAVGLDHRRGQPERAQLYLWEHHVREALRFAKPITDPADFAIVEGPEPLPSLERDKAGKPYNTLTNITAVFASPAACGATIRFDEFVGKVLVNGRPLKDIDYTRLRQRLEGLGWRDTALEKIRAGVHYVADLHQFDSAIEWLSGLRWDGKPRVMKFARDYLDCDQGEYADAASRYLWTSAAGRVLSPGCQADMSIVLVSPEGQLKSSSVAAIAGRGEYYRTLNLDLSQDDTARLLIGSTVIELEELAGMSRREMSHIKAFLSRRAEDWIPKFQEQAQHYARRNIFIGTTNDTAFLQEGDGNRRFIPLLVGQCQPEWIKEDCEQLWAEAAVLFTLGGVDWRDVHELSKAAREQHTQSDPWQEDIEAWLALSGFTDDGRHPDAGRLLTTSTILLEALHLGCQHHTMVAQHRVGRLMRGLGYTRKQIMADGARACVWLRPYLL